MSWVTTHDSIIDLRDLLPAQAFEKLHRRRKPRSENFSERRDIRCAALNLQNSRAIPQRNFYADRNSKGFDL
jgi:hypothetical protein